ncbi:hypothetical protein [Arthrobacter sp. B2a2-09]|uniref:hypothetical protein n=1 Tax=Arthrobacter sp. B2a2-09 TaxID=2952822 RepID=UPI0022CD2FD1|nr:hypothetical protein [Arthrobacter sp. B2a2-09]MCZ9883722.1 hypothetical protein [Arthrobacter sp. B2a2-09]
MSITAPYAADAQDRIRFSSRHVITATAYPVSGSPFELDVEDAQVQFDESWSPRIQATLTCKVPEDKTVLESLDARKNVRVKIYAGYVWDSVTEDIQLLADLHVRSREVKRPSNRLVLRCHSDEGLAQDYKRLAWDSAPPQSNLLDVVQYHANIAVIPGAAPTVVTDFPSNFGASAVSGVTQDPGQDSWSLLSDAANRAGVQIYCTGDRKWRIAARPVISSDTALNLTTGGGGIIKESTALYSREEFNNAVCIAYKWRDVSNVDHVLYGHAYISSGPFAMSAIGHNTYFEERNIPATQAQADAAATAALQAMAKRGRFFSIDAISAYWVLPGMTVTATLPTGDQERLLVSSVSFNFPSGAMSLRLRQPEDLTILNS